MDDSPSFKPELAIKYLESLGYRVIPPKPRRQAFKDMTGLRFGKLLVESPAHTPDNGQKYWNVVCDCGKRKAVKGAYLRRGQISCGCLRGRFPKMPR
jgi:hypothetical protein